MSHLPDERHVDERRGERRVRTRGGNGDAAGCAADVRPRDAGRAVGRHGGSESLRLRRPVRLDAEPSAQVQAGGLRRDRDEPRGRRVARGRAHHARAAGGPRRRRAIQVEDGAGGRGGRRGASAARRRTRPHRQQRRRPNSEGRPWRTSSGIASHQQLGRRLGRRAASTERPASAGGIRSQDYCVRHPDPSGLPRQARPAGCAASVPEQAPVTAPGAHGNLRRPQEPHRPPGAPLSLVGRGRASDGAQCAGRSLPCLPTSRGTEFERMTIVIFLIVVWWFAVVDRVRERDIQQKKFSKPTLSHRKLSFGILVDGRCRRCRASARRS